MEQIISNDSLDNKKENEKTSFIFVDDKEFKNIINFFENFILDDDSFFNIEIKIISKFIEEIKLKLKNDPIQIEKLARILAYRKLYFKSLITFRYLMKNFDFDVNKRKELFLIFDYIFRFFNFNQTYNKNRNEFINKYTPDWYLNYLVEYITRRYLQESEGSKKKLIEKIKELMTLINLKFEEINFINLPINLLQVEIVNLIKKKLFEEWDLKTLINIHNYTIEKSTKSDSFILGTKERVEKFHGQEIRVYRSLTEKLKFPLAQANFQGFTFLKTQTYPLKNFLRTKEFQRYLRDDESYPYAIEKFPNRKYEIPKEVIKPSDDCDVYYVNNPFGCTTNSIIKNILDNLSIKTQDYHNENYQNIIDPNLCVINEVIKSQNYYTDQIEVHDCYKWAATDFDIVEKTFYNDTLPIILRLFCSINKKKPFKKNVIFKIVNFVKNKKVPEAKICSPINSLNPSKNVELSVLIEKILSYSLPIISHLNKPALLLPGKLQAVMKAQRVYLKPGAEYEGVWHRDGKNENIVAVVIYYYNCSEGLIGGDLEFVDKKPIRDHLWMKGDCSADSYTEDEFKEDFEKMPKARVPVKTGTLVVFSNYQLIHRVLKIVHDENIKNDPKSPDKFCSRDFLLFFVVDQSHPLANTEEYRIKTEKNLLISDEVRKQIRDELFNEQILPTERFGLGRGFVHSTGNGSVAELGWMECGSTSSLENCESGMDRKGIKRLKKMNEPPPLERGLSWAFEGNISTEINQSIDENMMEEEEEEEEEENQI